MKWDEFCALLAGLSADSPLGRIVQIIAENDPKILKNFTVHQRKIRNEWRNKKALTVSDKSMDYSAPLCQDKKSKIIMTKDNLYDCTK